MICIKPGGTAGVDCMNALVPAIELYGTGAFSFAEKAGDDGAGAGGSGPADERRQINMKLENYEVHLPNYSIGDKIYDKIGPVCESL